MSQRPPLQNTCHQRASVAQTEAVALKPFSCIGPTHRRGFAGSGCARRSDTPDVIWIMPWGASVVQTDAVREPVGIAATSGCGVFFKSNKNAAHSECFCSCPVCSWFVFWTYGVSEIQSRQRCGLLPPPNPANGQCNGEQDGNDQSGDADTSQNRRTFDAAFRQYQN